MHSISVVQLGQRETYRGIYCFSIDVHSLFKFSSAFNPLVVSHPNYISPSIPCWLIVWQRATAKPTESLWSNNERCSLQPVFIWFNRAKYRKHSSSRRQFRAWLFLIFLNLMSSVQSWYLIECLPTLLQRPKLAEEIGGQLLTCIKDKVGQIRKHPNCL